MGGCWRLCQRSCVCFLTEEERRAILIDMEIQKILKEQKKRERKEIKVLLLGMCPTYNHTSVQLLHV